MRRSLLIILVFTLAFRAGAQDVLIPFLFTSEDDNRLIKENDTVKYYTASGDSAYTVAINEDASWYKLLNKERRMVAEGAFIAEGDKYLQDGKWVEKYDNGKVKRTGSYHRSRPVGTWQEYYSSGKIKIVSNYGIFLDKGQPSTCLSGSYEEYYQNGTPKVNGFYGGSIVTYSDTESVEDPVSGQKVDKIVRHKELRAEKTGHWEYYTESGELDRKEDL